MNTNINIKCSKCKKPILSTEYIVYKHKKICIFCMSYNEFNKLTITKYNNKSLLEFRLNKINKIAIIGKICSGKSFLANYLIDKYNFNRMSFAYPLKKIAKEYYGMEDKDRELLQDLAIKMKEIDNNVFVNYLIKNMNKEDNIVIDDLRFENELLELKKHNFIIIKLNIDKKNQMNRYLKLYNNLYIDRINHNSETEQDNLPKKLIDYELNSDEFLLSNIDNIMKN